MFFKVNCCFILEQQKIILVRTINKNYSILELHEQNKILNQQREKTGRQIQSTIAKSGKNQKDFLKSSGIALRGGNLNAKALARLRERGLI